MPKPTKLEPGDPIQALNWNAIVDSLPAPGTGSGHGGQALPWLIRVQNSSGSGRGVGEVLQIQISGWIGAINKHALLDGNASVDGQTPTAADNRLVLTAEPIPDGATGWCVAMGVGVCKVQNYTAELAVGWKSGQSDDHWMTADNAGSIPIITKIGGSTVLVLMGGSAAISAHGVGQVGATPIPARSGTTAGRGDITLGKILDTGAIQIDGEVETANNMFQTEITANAYVTWLKDAGEFVIVSEDCPPPPPSGPVNP